MKRSLRGVSRGLLALTLLAAVIAFCPCEGIGSGMDDCCQPTELSMASLCCVREAASPLAVAATSMLASPAVSGLTLGAWSAPAPFVLPDSGAILGRPVVARAILRI